MTLTATQQGYGNSHQRLRKCWKAQVEAGVVTCARCGGWIAPGSRWHLGHDHDFGGYAGPEHARCNLAERNKRHARKRRRGTPRPGTPSRVW